VGTVSTPFALSLGFKGRLSLFEVAGAVVLMTGGRIFKGCVSVFIASRSDEHVSICLRLKFSNLTFAVKFFETPTAPLRPLSKLPPPAAEKSKEFLADLIFRFFGKLFKL
jgi:hypothetical protein